MVWNNSVVLFALITFVATSSIDFGVLVCVVGSLDLSANDPNSYTTILPSSNSNGNPFANFGLLGATCGYVGLNSWKASCVATFFIYSSITCWPSCVYCCWCCKCCGVAVVHTSNLHIHLHQSANVLHLLEPLCHVPWVPTFAPSIIFPMEMWSMVPPTSTPLVASLVELSSLVFSSLSSCMYHYWHYRWFHFAPHHFFMPLNLCLLVPFSLLNLRLLLPQLYSSFPNHFLESLL